MYGVIALPLALWAATPAIRVCPPGDGDARTECVAGTADAAQLEIAAHLSGCPRLLACARQRHKSRGCAAAQHRAPASPGATNRREFCLGGPNGGSGVRTHSVRISIDATPLAVAVAQDAGLEPMRREARVQPARLARPPTRFWTTRPPVRGPPLT